MKGIFYIKPPSCTLIPSWDLKVALLFLQGSPFEPLSRASLEALTFKTVFLVALASARRCSELQALARSSPYVRFEREGIRVRTTPGFLPKTANPTHLGEDIFLPTFPKNTKLCVVRCLKQYLSITNALMSIKRIKHNHLFVCYGTRNKLKPVSKRTISGWLVKIIKAAYAAAGKALPSVKAHSTRAQATTWALFNGASLESILRAADWRRPSTFVKHYGLDVWRAQEASFGRSVLKVPSEQ